MSQLSNSVSTTALNMHTFFHQLVAYFNIFLPDDKIDSDTESEYTEDDGSTTTATTEDESSADFSDIPEGFGSVHWASKPLDSIVVKVFVSSTHSEYLNIATISVRSVSSLFLLQRSSES